MMPESSTNPSLAASDQGAGSLLDTLTGAVREELLAIARPVSFQKDAFLLRQGAPTRGAYLLRAGTVAATVRLPGGETLAVAEIPAGGVIGEMSLLDHGTCSASVTALSPVDALFIPRDDFRVLVARHSAAALSVQHTLTRNLCTKLAALNARLLAYPAPEDLPFYAAPATDPLAGWARTHTASFAYPAFLPILPVFADWESEAIEELLAQTRVLELPRGHAIFFEGAVAAACFITVRGAVEVSAPTVVSNRDDAHLMRIRRLAILGPGQLVGYRSMIDAMPTEVRVRAREATLLLELPGGAFLQLYHGDTPAALRLQGVVHRALLHSMAHTNVTLTRLVNLSRLQAARQFELEAALAEQAAYAS